MKKWLNDFLWEEKPDFEKKESTTPVATTVTLPPRPAIVGGTTQTPVVFATSVIPNNTIAVATINPQIREQLLQAVQAVVDPKYAQFKTMSDSMKTVIPDIRQRFSAAFLAVKGSTGATKESLVQGATLMLDALRKEKADFDKEIGGATASLQGSVKEKADKVQALVVQKEQQVQQLIAEIEGLKATHSNECAAINAQLGEIEATKAQFNATQAELEKELTTEINDLATYIQG